MSAIGNGGDVGSGPNQNIGGTSPATGQLSVDQQRNQALYAIYNALKVFVTGGTISGNLAITGTLAVSGTITPNSVKGIVGTTTNDNAQAGSVGEYISLNVPIGSAVSLTTATAKDIGSIALSAGDWDVTGVVGFIPAGTTIIALPGCWISTTSATVPTAPNAGALNYGPAVAQTAGVQVTMPTGKIRLSLAAPTTVYLGGYCQFSVSTCTAFGFIGARRVR